MTPLEKVAIAIGEAGDYGTDIAGMLKETVHQGDCTKQPFTCLVCLSDELRSMARAAIEALMEPSEAMIEAGHIYVFNAPMNPTKLQLLGAFYAMLIKALEK